MNPKSIKAIAILILIAAYPLSAGILFHSDALSWAGVGIIAIVCLWFLAEFSVLVWTLAHQQESRLIRTGSKDLADEYLHVGWTLKQEFGVSATDKPILYCLEWLRDGKPARPMIGATKFARGIDDQPSRFRQQRPEKSHVTRRSNHRANNRED